MQRKRQKKVSYINFLISATTKMENEQISSPPSLFVLLKQIVSICEKDRQKYEILSF